MIGDESDLQIKKESIQGKLYHEYEIFCQICTKHPIKVNGYGQMPELIAARHVSVHILYIEQYRTSIYLAVD